MPLRQTGFRDGVGLFLIDAAVLDQPCGQDAVVGFIQQALDNLRLPFGRELGPGLAEAILVRKARSS